MEMPPDAKLPSSHIPLTIRQRLGYLTATFFFCSNALIALARSLCKCLLAQLITASGANAVKGYLVRCACIDGTIP